MTPTDDVVIRLARPSDGARCNAFYNQYYGRNRTVTQWEWEFCRRISDDGTIPFAVAEHGGEIVGTQALIPIELVDRDGAYWSAKSEETLVAASMRGRGLLHRLYAPLLEVARQQQLECIWGFTPASSAFEREGFATPARTGQLLRAFTSAAAGALLGERSQRRAMRVVGPLASVALATYGTVATATARRGDTDVQLEVLSEAPDWADALSLQFAREWRATTLHRSSDYMRWRFFENPFRRPIVVSARVAGRPIGWIAFGVGQTGVAAVVDILVVQPPNGVDAATVIAALLRDATRRSREMGASAMRAWQVTSHPFAELVRTTARRLGWIHVRRGFDMVLKPTPGIATRAESVPIDRWYVTRAFTEGSDI